MLWFVANNPEGDKPEFDAAAFPMMWGGALAGALMMCVTSFVLPKLMLKVDPSKPMTRDQAMARFNTSRILAFALANGACTIGFVVCFITTQDVLHLAPFVALSVATIGVQFPRSSDLQELLANAQPGD